MKNFLYKHVQRVIGGFLAIMMTLAAMSVLGIIGPETVSNYFKSMKTKDKTLRITTVKE